MKYTARALTNSVAAIRRELPDCSADQEQDSAHHIVLTSSVDAAATPDADRVRQVASALGIVVLRGRTGLLLSGPVRGLRELADRLHTFMPEWAAALVSALEARKPARLTARGRGLPLGERTLVMGILNASPDSFSGDGLAHTAGAVEQARGFLRAGADILDVGAMSTRPGAEIIPEHVEAERLRAVITALRPLTDMPISADTFRLEPARAALDAGADILNDISGLRDARMAQLAASYGAGVVVMHMQGTPETMQRDPRYTDVVGEVYDVLAKGVATAMEAGVPDEGIIVDPGIGFGKTFDHNIELLHRLPEFNGLGHALLAGTSRKAFIGRITGREVGERAAGTAATVALAIAGGADIVRVHDVEQIVDVCRVSDRIVRWGPAPSGDTVER